MPNVQTDFVRVAALEEISEGKPKAVKVEGRSIALFKNNGEVFATDNQCPHMGYPLTRGRVRNGVLTCDWHGWSYDMEGGGCFTGGCDDLDTFPVEVRDKDIYVNVNTGGSKRSDAHFLLMKEGLLRGDNWTLSKAIAILLAKGVSEEETMNLLVKHLGRHIATEKGADGGRDVALLINGMKIAHKYEPEDRLIPLMMAAKGASGQAGDRVAVRPLPQPTDWEKLQKWTRYFSEDKMWEGIEKCLITARHLKGHDEKIVPLLYECAVSPYFIGQNDNLLHLGYLAEVLEAFGWEQAEELVCNLAGKMLGRPRRVPQEVKREAIELFESLSDLIHTSATHPPQDETADFDADSLADGLVSGDLQTTFAAISEALKAGAHIHQIVSTMVLLAGDRMARTPVNMSPGWGDLAWEMNLASSVRTALRFGGYEVGARALYHAAWQFFNDRWLNISPRSLREPQGNTPLDAADEDTGLQTVLNAIEEVKIREIGRLVREYLNAGFSGDRLLSEVGLTILKDDNGWNLLHTLRTIFDEWQLCEGHPARNQLLVGISRWATDVRRRTGSQSAAQTAQRFAKGETAVELYE